MSSLSLQVSEANFEKFRSSRSHGSQLHQEPRKDGKERTEGPLSLGNSDTMVKACRPEKRSGRFDVVSNRGRVDATRNSTTFGTSE